MIENLVNVQVILMEVHNALKNLIATGETYTIYVGTTGLSEEEQVEVLETLGRGDITITFKETDQPVEWYETAFRGIWVGTYRNGRDEAVTYTIEVARYPEVAGAYPEDMEISAAELLTWAEAAGV